MDASEDEILLGSEILATLEERGRDEPMMESGSIDDGIGNAEVGEDAKEALREAVKGRDGFNLFL